MILTFGKHNGKSINDLMNEGEYSYIVWLEENVDKVNVYADTYKYCKEYVFIEQIEHEAKMESMNG